MKTLQPRFEFLQAFINFKCWEQMSRDEVFSPRDISIIIKTSIFALRPSAMGDRLRGNGRNSGARWSTIWARRTYGCRQFWRLVNFLDPPARTHRNAAGRNFVSGMMRTAIFRAVIRLIKPIISIRTECWMGRFGRSLQRGNGGAAKNSPHHYPHSSRS